MTDDWYDDYDEDRLVREAVRQLIDNHRDEYLELVGKTHESRISELQDQARRDKDEIRKLKEKVANTIVERDRWRARLEPDGRLVRDV